MNDDGSRSQPQQPDYNATIKLAELVARLEAYRLADPRTAEILTPVEVSFAVEVFTEALRDIGTMLDSLQAQVVELAGGTEALLDMIGGKTGLDARLRVLERLESARAASSSRMWS